MQAFLGDQTLKDRIEQRLTDDLKRHAIEQGPTAWRDDRGSIAGSMLRSAALADGPSVLGIPQDVLALLDHIGGHIYFAWVSLPTLASSFINSIRPGADLTGVADVLIERMTDALGPAALSSEDRAEDEAELAAMLAKSARTPDDVIALVNQWLHIRSREAVRASGWTEAQEGTAQETLNRLWDDTSALRAAGQSPDYPALFRETDPPLAEGYEKALAVSNASFADDATLVARWFIDALRAA